MRVEIRNLQRLRLPPVRKIKALAGAVLKAGGPRFPSARVSFVFVSDVRMALLNRLFLTRRGSTDVLAFDYANGEGEIVISAARARAQSQRFGMSYRDELALYVIHGLLHLLGYRDHPRSAARRLQAEEQRLLDWAARNHLLF